MSFNFNTGIRLKLIYLSLFFIFQIIQSAVNLILQNERQHEKNIFTDGKQPLIILIIVCFFVVIIFIFYFKKRTQKEKESIVNPKNEDLDAQEQQFPISLEEVVEEAQKNSPSFLEKLQLYSPQFTLILTENYSNLNSRELTLLAYIYLNFSTKEIANSTFRSYRTIQSQKYVPGLDSKDYFYVWLKGLFGKV